MKKPDLTRFAGRKEMKADELEMKGFSSPQPFGIARPKTVKSIRAPQRASKQANKQESNMASKQASLMTSHMTLLQFTEADYETLREPACKSQTFRLSQEDVYWFRDTAHELDKKVQRGKVTQADILKLCKKIFEKLLDSNKRELVEILKKFK